MSIRLRGGVATDPVIQAARLLLVPSFAARQVFVDAGVPATQLEVVLNGVEDVQRREAPIDRVGFIFAGRISAEKGLLELLEDWPNNIRLDIVGEGPLLEEVRSACRHKSAITVLGHLSRGRVIELLPGYRGLVIPSRWIEAGVTLVLAEALMAGTPVLAREGNSAADFITRLGGGRVYSDGASLHAAIREWPEPEAWNPSPRSLFEQNLTAHLWIRQLEAVYDRVRSRRTS
jgi:glycosyltransferase involved in cell wall biosynthesis